MDYHNKNIALIRELMHSNIMENLPRNALASLLVKIGASLLAFLINVVLARFLGLAEYGLFIYAAGWLNILLIPANLGFDKLLVREIAVYQSRNEWGKLKGIYQFAMSSTLGMSIVIALSLFAAIYFAASSQTPTQIFYWAALLIPIGAIIRIQQATLQGLYYIAMSQLSEFIIQPTALLLLSILAYYWPQQSLMAPQVMILNVLAGAIAFLIGRHLLQRSWPSEANTVNSILDLRSWIPSLIPFMLFGGIFILNEQVSTVMLGLLSNTRQVAVFTAAEKWSVFAIFMLQALNPALAPIFAKLYALHEQERLQKIVTLSSQVITLFALIPLLAFVLVPQLFLSTFGDEFAAGKIPLIILGVGQFINAFTGSVGVLLIMTGHERTVVRCFAAGVLVNLLLGIGLIPFMNATGAAISASASVIITNILLSISVFQKVRIVPTPLGRLFVDRNVSSS
jgi:O-antigen/teichoic acid export membrane protein